MSPRAVPMDIARVHAELTLGMRITVCPRTVSVLMTLAGIYGLVDDG